MNKRVLIVEDDDLLRDMYAFRLGMEGYTVDTASDGVEGLDMATKFMPDLVLLDMLMPRLDGLGFLRKFKDLAKTTRATVIVASNKSSTQSIQQAKLLGAAEYLIKSQLTPDEIVVHVNKHISGKS